MSLDTVAFVSLVVSDAPTVSWVPGTTVAVDGGTASFTSAEGYEQLAGLGADAFLEAGDVAFDSLTAHDGLITEVPIGDGTDLALFSTGTAMAVMASTSAWTPTASRRDT